MLKVAGLCVAAALICAALRSAHPQIATAAALACGVGAMLLSTQELGDLAGALEKLESAANGAQGEGLRLLKLCGAALVAEFASDICRDAGEASLAKRIDMGMRIGVTAAALPTAAELMELLAELLT